MARFRILVERTTYEQAEIEIEASSEVEAEAIYDAMSEEEIDKQVCEWDYDPDCPYEIDLIGIELKEKQDGEG